MSMQKPMVADVLLTGNDGELTGNRMCLLGALYHARIIAGMFRLNGADNQGPVLQHLSTLSHCIPTFTMTETISPANIHQHAGLLDNYREHGHAFRFSTIQCKYTQFHGLQLSSPCS